MILERTPEDRLREEYFDLLPDIRRVAGYLEVEIRYHTRHILQRLKQYEQLVIKSRVKECESALETLRGKGSRKSEGRTFDPERPEDYAIANLPDLAGVRVLVFPRARLIEVHNALRGLFTDWVPDPVRDDSGAVLAETYHGYCGSVSSKVQGEYQIVPMLIGLFWEVEHSAMYKVRDVANSKEMKKHRADVERALSRFEDGIEGFVRDYAPPSSENS
jgi:hypothetical protein